MAQLQTFTVTVGSTALGAAAAGLSTGQSVSFSTLPSGIGAFGISWQCQTGFWDSTRDEFQFSAKAQNGGPFHHCRYSESGDSWLFDENIFAHPPGLDDGNRGHAWNVSMDHLGRYWHKPYRASFVRWFDPADQTWRTTSTNAAIGNSQAGDVGPGLAYHPDLFDTNDGGLIVYTKARIVAWRESTDTWQTLEDYGVFNNGPYSNHGNGSSLWMPSRDEVIIGSGDVNAAAPPRFPIIAYGAGTAGTPASVQDRGDPPIEVYGDNNNGHGKMIIDPRNSAHLLILEDSGTARVWRSEDGAASWVLESFTHPFLTLMTPNDGGEWTIGGVPKYGGLVWGMGSTDGGGVFQSESYIWKVG